MKSTLRALSFALIGLGASLGLSPSASAATCGTLAAPTACSITLANNVTFTASGFGLPVSNASGGGEIYAQGDIAIAISASSSDTVRMLFSFNPDGPSTRSSFNVNSGETSGFSITYILTASPAIAGTVDIIDPMIVSVTQSNAGDGFAAVQLLVPGGPGGCQAFSSVPSETCTGLPPSLTTSTEVGNIVSLTGNTGNAAIINFSDEFRATFTAAPPTSVSVAPSASLLLLGLLSLPLARRRRAE